MRRFALLSFLAWSSAALAAPTLDTISEDEVTVAVPQGWKHMITADERNIVMSRDAGTTINMHWYTYKEGISQDKMLDKLLSVTNENLPMGSAIEVARKEILEGRGKVMTADFSTLGYEMKMAFTVVLHPEQGHVATAIMLSSPDTWKELEGETLIANVTESLQAKITPPTESE
jgi:hypothetical protein